MENRWQKLCEYIGFKLVRKRDPDGGSMYVWKWPGKSKVTHNLPPRDLNILYEYFAPKFWVFDLMLEDGIFYVARVGHPDSGDGEIHHHSSEDPVKALTQAMYKAIVKEV